MPVHAPQPRPGISGGTCRVRVPRTGFHRRDPTLRKIFSGRIVAPMPPPYPSALERMKWINQAVKSAPYSILFFGDSLTEGWDTEVWKRTLASRGALNAGVSGDRTDHLCGGCNTAISPAHSQKQWCCSS